MLWRSDVHAYDLFSLCFVSCYFYHSPTPSQSPSLHISASGYWEHLAGNWFGLLLFWWQQLKHVGWCAGWCWKEQAEIVMGKRKSCRESFRGGLRNIQIVLLFIGANHIQKFNIVHYILYLLMKSRWHEKWLSGFNSKKQQNQISVSCTVLGEIGRVWGHTWLLIKHSWAQRISQTVTDMWQGNRGLRLFKITNCYKCLAIKETMNLNTIW